MASKKTTKRTAVAKTGYVAVSHHIYHDGTSYRVRAMRDGNKISQNFSSKKKAFEFRKKVLSA